MRISLLLIYGWLLLLCTSNLVAQGIQVVAETPSFIDYEIKNEALRIMPAHSLLIPIVNGSPQYKILEQAIVSIPDTLSRAKKDVLFLVSDSTSVVETFTSGFFRGKEVAPTAIHIARIGKSELLVTRLLKIRVYKDTSAPARIKQSQMSLQASPLATGSWYKIPISKNGIYEITSNYLSELGINVNSINPKNIQIWGMGGTVLPEANSAPKPEFVQIPIIVEGESDNNFDPADRIIFYANGPNRAYHNSTTFVNEVHPYSKVNYVFLTIGSSPGARLAAINTSLNPTRTITTFKDFLWKEDELVKAEVSLRSGRQWLGQTINASQSGSFVSVLKDTLAGIVPNSAVSVSGQIYGRSLSRLYINAQLNGSPIAAVTTSPISNFNASEGPTARVATFSNTITPNISNGVLNVELKTTHQSNNDQVFIDWIRLIVERELILNGTNLFFNTTNDPTNIDVASFVLKGFVTQPFVMDVTNPTAPKLLDISKSGGNYLLNYYTGSNLQIIAQSQLSVPKKGVAIKNQNLRAIPVYPDYLVITSEALLGQALELSNYREAQGLTPFVVTQEDIFNEFSGGMKDPSALRNYVKYIWDASIANNEKQLLYLLLFGDATYDTKGIVSNALIDHVATFQSKESISREGTYGTDDYFGYLDVNEGDFGSGNTSNSFLMDIGIGRIPVQTASEARDFIIKVKAYENPNNKGMWQNQITFAADDDYPTQSEKDLHTYNADVSAELMNVNEPGIRIKKIYEFSYPAEITGAGRKYPEATKDFINAINQGTLALSYSGHGNEQVLSDEGLFISDYIPSFTNKDKLAILITVTCQFGRYDDTSAQSGAEKFVLANNGGAIASFTTTRVVYTSADMSNNSNFALSIALSQRLTERNANGVPKRLGEISMQTKNSIIPGSSVRIGSSLNNKKFILLGDPATVFQLPAKKAHIATIDTTNVTNLSAPITIRALDTIEISGEILDAEGNVDTQYNGQTTLTIYDARRKVSFPERSWINNPATDCRFDNCQYAIENDMLFKGKASVSNGIFSVPVIIPKDISSSATTGRILVFANAEGNTASGAFTQINFVGINPDAKNDHTGPKIDIYLNDQSFINGTLVNSSPTLFVELEDDSGINTSGTGVGHEIIATIDTKPKQTIILNEFFEGNLNSFTGGRIEYPLDELPEGSYTLKVRAWDVHNNPSENEIFFEVAAQEELAVRNIYNYPNPMNNKTSFTFEHNQPGNPLDVSVRIYTLSGKPVQHLKGSIITSSNYASISWNGRDRDNDRLGNGTYIYVLRVTTTTPKGRQSTEKIEKLVIIR